MENRLPKIKKDITDFLTEEEGSIDKKNAVNLAITTVVLGTVFYSTTADAHNSYLVNNVDAGGHYSLATGVHSAPDHTSNLANNANGGLHNSHTSHSSCHSNCHDNCHTNHGNCHSNCHSNAHQSCHSEQHTSCHVNDTDSWGSIHDSCHVNCHSDTTPW